MAVPAAGDQPYTTSSQPCLGDVVQEELDGQGQLFKLQLLDADGGHQDHYTRVDFSGWRYCQFDLGAASLKNLGKIRAISSG